MKNILAVSILLLCIIYGCERNSTEIRFGYGNRPPGEWLGNAKVKHGGSLNWRDEQTQVFGDDCRPSGSSVIVWQDGSKYIGESGDYEREGKGSMVWADGSTFKGYFIAGAPNGYGKGVTKYGVKYEGEVRDGLANGRGVAVFPDGTRREGEFRQGDFVGKK